MNFCDDCDDMLYIKIKSNKNKKADDNDEDKLIYLCRTCNREYIQDEKTTNCVYHVNYNHDNIKKESLLNEYTFYDPTLPKATGIKCPNKDCPVKKNPNIIYLNYDNKEMKYLYICLDCKNAKITPYVW
jgi:DNA-directed RNA polymerase subunit M/transcription elongation factor TFIIS